MFKRHLELPDDESLFLFGPRATGKTTLLKHAKWFECACYINLLSIEEERRFSRNPDELSAVVAKLPEQIAYVVIDEIQKIPKLLDVVHHLIESTSKKFILTGSSARKLKYGGANLLAGRAFVYDLHPFTYLEITKDFHVVDLLRWGMLPKIFSYSTDDKKNRYLEAYVNTYLKEEIWVEQFIRELDPFRHFLEVAAQCNGKIINFSNIARDVGVAVTTVQKYFSILLDTLVGFFLEGYQHSFRKRLSKSPKFYFFDPGIVSALTNQLSLPIHESTSRYGDAFEHFIILQCKSLASYFHREYRFSYLQTKDGAEIDLVVERPGLPILFIEIKSTKQVEAHHLKQLKAFKNDFGKCEVMCLSQDKYAKEIDGISVYPWREGVAKYFAIG